MNNKGSLLLLTVMFVLVFTLLGLGSVFLSGMNNRMAQRQAASDEAFWLADGAIERARSVLPAKLFSSGDYTQIPLGNGNYDISSARDTIVDGNGNVIYTYKYRWNAESRGYVRQQSRGIRAVLSALENSFIVKTRGFIKDMDKCPQASIIIDCGKVRENARFSLDTYFKGLSLAAIKNRASRTYTDPANAGDVNPVENITVINLINNSSVNITTDNIINNSAVFLLVDTSAVSGNPANPPQIKIAGNAVFQGIIWIIGEAELTGTSAIRGTVFVQGDPARETKLSGNITLDLDEAEVEKAVSLLGQSALFLPGDPRIIAWEEI